MNYYERHLGDYARDTGHLSILEHGVYTLLLDRYYSTEEGIPADKAYRFSHARTPEEMAAVDVVLEEFFVLSEGVWFNQRADEEIAKTKARIVAAVENGKKGGRPPKGGNGKKPSPEKPNPFENETQQKPNPFENETQTKAHQTPNTIHQTPVVKNTLTGNFESVGEIEIAGRVCVALRDVGIMQTNPNHADLLQLIRDGTTLEEFVSAGSIAADKGKGFAYALGIAKSHKREKINGKNHVNTKPSQRENQVDPRFAEKYSWV